MFDVFRPFPFIFEMHKINDARERKHHSQIKLFGQTVPSASLIIPECSNWGVSSSSFRCATIEDLYDDDFGDLESVG